MSDAFAFPQLERPNGNVNAARIAALTGLAVAIAAAAGVLIGRSSAGGHAAPTTSLPRLRRWSARSRAWVDFPLP